MPAFSWSTDPIPAIQPFEARHQNPDAGALLAWAAWGVESLYYLDDIDRLVSSSPSTFQPHRPDVVDVAHARWATGTCITSLDLCAAAIGRVYCGHTSERELALTDFDLRKGSKARAFRSMLPATVLAWVDQVFADQEYVEVKLARDSLTHSWLPRHFTLAAGGSGPNPSIRVQVGAHQKEVREVVETARDVAARHISSLLAALPTW